LLLLLLTRKEEKTAMMNRRSSSSPRAVSFTKLSTSEHEEDLLEDGAIPVVAEYVTAVVAEHKEPSSTIFLPIKVKNILEQGRLTWTDDFFEQPGHDDVVAVFDYDLELLKKILVEEKFGLAIILAPNVFMGAFFWCMMTGGPFLAVLLFGVLLLTAVYMVVTEKFGVAKVLSIMAFLGSIVWPLSDPGYPLLVVALCGSLFAFGAMFGWIRHAEATMPVVVKSWLHTAVTQTGLRHIQTLPTPGNVFPAGAFALDIPFENIVSIKRTATPRNVLLTLASTNDGVEFISSGDCYFQSVWGTPSQVSLALTNLKEPVLFMKVLQAMKDKSSVATKSFCSSKATEWLWRLDTILDNGSSDPLSDPNIKQSLRELVVEMCELSNNNNSNNTSSSIEPHDVTTIV
jgi:hypothetical protein